jgi:hypothetical protein
MIEAISFEGKYFRRDIGYEFGPLPPGGEAEAHQQTTF